jgi:thioredoxin 1
MDGLESLRARRMQELMTLKMDSGKPIELTDEMFAGEVAKSDLIVVDCWAPWCGPCRMMTPVIDELAKECAGKIAFGKLNVDDNPNVAAAHKIMSIPTLLVFKKGRLVDRITGAMPKAMLEPKLKAHLK